MDYYAHEVNGIFRDVFQLPMQVKMCGSVPIIPVKVIIDENGPYFAWQAVGEDSVCMIFETFLMLKTCFQYGIQKAIDAGQGKMVKVTITKR